MSETITAFTLRSISITDYGWISYTSTTMESDDEAAFNLARAANNRELHRIIATEPPKFALRIPTAWKPPTDDTRVTIRETVIEQDLMTGVGLFEREIDEYQINYPSLIGE